ncbi:MAG: response regulator [Sandaracinaceae bacterium]|nr:response regulator [Myxococcales bacterium]MCB9657468.1 response regulator [Sandaracinaceae bacterium]
MLESVSVPPAFAPVFERAQEYVRQYFQELRQEPERGTIGVADERYVLVRARALSVEFVDVVRELYGSQGDQGTKVAREILFDLAHAMGMSDARVFAERLGVQDPVEKLSAGPVHFAHAGWAFVDIHADSRPRPDDDFVLYYDHPYSMEADGWIAAGRHADFPVCVMNSGYSSGWCESAFEMPLVAAEITCRAMGDAQCRFIMAPPARIAERIDAYTAAHPEVVRRAERVEVPGFFRRKGTSEAQAAHAEQLARENVELERRVEERTQALQRANEALTRELNERREAEAALRQSEAINRHIVEAVPSGIVHVAADGAIHAANGEAQRILGLAYDELTRRYTTDFATETIWESGQPAAPEDYPVTRALVTGEPQGPETLGVRRPDGATSWAIFRASPVRAPNTGELTGAIVTFVDITERKADEELRRQLEDQVQRSEKLESLGLLAGGVAHDFNNLLVGILGNASWLARGLEPGSREWQATQHIVTAGRRAADLTKQMLAYAGRAQLETVTVDVRALVAEMRDLLQSRVPDGVAVHYALGTEARAVLGDPAQLGQVVMNLITNAGDAAHQRHAGAGRVDVSVSRVALSEEALRQMHQHGRAQPGAFVCVSVTDDGVGLERETLPHVFDPFFTTKKGGHGLGLAAVLGIIRAHAGALDIQSEVGVGTTFRVFIPVGAPSHAGPKTTPSGGVAPPLSGLFLVVDDEPTVRTLAAAALTDLGLSVAQARDGREGLQRYAVHGDDVRGILLDLTMPGVDGYEVLREVRRTKPSLPVVLCSGYDRHEVLDRLPPDPHCVFLSKPFTVEQLEHAVRTVLATMS